MPGKSIAEVHAQVDLPNAKWTAAMRAVILVGMCFLAAAWAHAACPNTFSAKSGLPGHVEDWTTIYDLRAGTFKSRHVSGNTISGKVAATCSDRTITLDESETTNNNDGRCELTRVNARRFEGTCTPRGFDIRIEGF